MRKVTISIQVDAQKLRAIQFYVGKKDSTLESELEDCITKIYEKYVPAQTREYIECISASERPLRPSRSVLRTEEAGGER
ncbi:MAG: hypothetical protein HFF73_14410 [Oscillospiraceae bacterium]|nr:hypothetical protein [Oscillospiraceae bacterium]